MLALQIYLINYSIILEVLTPAIMLVDRRILIIFQAAEQAALHKLVEGVPFLLVYLLFSF
jgi:hypothetical protein